MCYLDDKERVLKLDQIDDYFLHISHDILNLPPGHMEYPDFKDFPASTRFHHGYDFGLAFHTFEVVYNTMLMADSMQANMLVSFMASIFHDYGKIYDYVKKDGLWVKSDSYTNQSHFITGKKLFLDSHNATWMKDEDIKAVLHCIDAHHGRKEWATIEEPKTVEALILHQADHLSASFGPTKDSPFHS